MAGSSGQGDERTAIKEAKRALDEAQKSYKSRVKEARDELSRAEQARERELGDARRELREAQKAHDKRVVDASNHLDQSRHKSLGSYGDVRLYDNRLESSEGTVPLSSEINASVESSGEKTGNADTRELYLTIDTPTYQKVIKCTPGDTAKVRELAAAINTAAKNAEARIREHDERVRAAEQEVAAAKQDTSAITEAEGRVTRLEQNTASVDAARERLAQVEADTSEIDARGAELLALDPAAKVGPPKLPRRSFRWWSRRSRWAKAGIIAATVLVALIILGVAFPAEETKDEAASPATTSSPPSTQQATEPPPPSTSTPAPPPPKPATPQEELRNALGGEVAAGGYAGDVKIMDVAFDGREAQITAETPEGGLQGASCGDLNDGSQAIFKTVYLDASWNGGAVIVYKGGLVSTETGEDLPDVNTGIFTMHAAQARRINWSDEDALDNINWTIYRDYCHPALE